MDSPQHESNQNTVQTRKRQGRQSVDAQTRASIIAAVKAGQSRTEVAAAFSVTRQTVYNTLKRVQQQQQEENLSLDPTQKTSSSLHNKPKSGRPRKLTPRAEGQLLRMVRRFPTMTWEDLARAMTAEGGGVSVSVATLQRAFRRRCVRKGKIAKD